MMLRRIAQFGVMMLAVAATPAAAAIHVVDCAAGPFRDIASAVDAAAAGDSVLVRRCRLGPYAPFEVVGKERVHVLAASPASEAGGGAPPGPPAATFRPRVLVDCGGALSGILIDGSAGVTVQGFRVRDCSFNAIKVQNSSGTRIIGNRIDHGIEAIRDQSSTNSSYLGNLVNAAAFSIFLDSDDALVANNLILRDVVNGIVILGSGHHVVGNVVRLGGAAGISEQGLGSRIERNRCLDNGQGPQIRISEFSTDADVISNVTGDSILDLGTGTDLADNR